MQRGWREALGVSEQNHLDAPFVGHLQSAISLFLRKTSNRRDLSNVVKVRGAHTRAQTYIHTHTCAHLHEVEL